VTVPGDIVVHRREHVDGDESRTEFDQPGRSQAVVAELSRTVSRSQRIVFDSERHRHRLVNDPEFARRLPVPDVDACESDRSG
jgi:hypothetical protein